ncbi:hypothetical protein EVAR_17176_1 [Eumeta japonica]|uniref:Uncharacterized protein n=1 Tax=Eumeta variegata TaxID=151549 RepID=A0A4C1U8X7_EUMVA|nr:hypothetical protein EVAR_17176_1 [Eumeta japonica]
MSIGGGLWLLIIQNFLIALSTGLSPLVGKASQVKIAARTSYRRTARRWTDRRLHGDVVSPPVTGVPGPLIADIDKGVLHSLVIII